MKRLAVTIAFAALLAGVLSMSGSAASFDDSHPCPAQGPLLVCPQAQVGQPYGPNGAGLQLIALAGCDQYRWEIVNGSLPPGLKMSSSGLVTGTPTGTEETHPWVVVHDLLPSEGGYPWCGGDNHSERQFVFEAVPGLDIDQSEASAPPGTVNQPYSVKFTATSVTSLNPRTGSPATATWSIQSGSLPTGLSFSTDGTLSGTPTQEGSWTFVIHAERGGIGDHETKTLTVRQPMAATSQLTTSRRLEVGIPYTATQSATGGSGSYTWTVASGTLPTGVELKPDGTVTGTPTVPGSYTFSIKVADTEGRSQTVNTTLVVADRLAITTTTLKQAKVKRPYRQKIERTGGVAPLEWKLARGKLPNGVTLAKKLGLLLGTPAKAGTYKIEVEAVDSFGVKSAAKLTLVVKSSAGGKKR
jgi:large repetitive protein